MEEAPRVEHAEEEGTHTFRTARGSVTLHAEAKTVIVGKAGGHLGRELLPPVLDSVEQILAGLPPVDVFCHCEDVEGYDPLIRKTLTDWVRENKDRVLSVNVLATNNIVNMGITVANLRLSGFVWTWSEPEEFAREIQYRVVECRRGLPRVERRR